MLDPVSVEPSEECAGIAAPETRRGMDTRWGISHAVRAGRTIFGDDGHGVIKSGRLAGLSMNHAIFVASWPVLCESILNSTIALVDTVLASKISIQAADAVGGASYMVWFIGLITMAIGVGATALIARSMGAGKLAVARGALGQAILLAAIGGVFTAVLLASLAGPIASLLSLKGQAREDIITYLRAYSLGVPFSTILFAGTACARGMGDTIRPLMTMIVVNIVNLFAAWLLALQLNLGVLGIGLGTAIAHAVGAGVVLYFHIKGTGGVSLTMRWLRPHRTTLSRLVRLGLPNFAETFGMWFVNMLIILMVGSMSASAVINGGLGTAAAVAADAGGLLGAHSWAIRIEAYSFLPGFSMGLAASALAGQYLGAGAPELARRAAIKCAAIACVIMGFAGIVLAVAGDPVVRALTPQAVHVQIVPQLLWITGLVQVPFAIAIVLRSAMHGAGDVRAVMIMTWVSQWGLRLPLAYAISGVDIHVPSWLAGRADMIIENPFPFDLGLRGLWIGLCIEICIRAMIYAGRFIHGGWMLARV
jgi:putative MATE family efflux protein